MAFGSGCAIGESIGPTHAKERVDERHRVERDVRILFKHSDGDLDAVLRTLRAARGARATLETTNALETTTAAVRKAKADVEARCLEATVVIKAVPSPGGAFLAAALGLSNATVIEADLSLIHI